MSAVFSGHGFERLSPVYDDLYINLSIQWELVITKYTKNCLTTRTQQQGAEIYSYASERLNCMIITCTCNTKLLLPLSRHKEVEQLVRQRLYSQLMLIIRWATLVPETLLRLKTGKKKRKEGSLNSKRYFSRELNRFFSEINKGSNFI